MTDRDRVEEVDRVGRLKAQYGIDVTFRGSFSSLYFLVREAPFADAVDSFHPSENSLSIEALDKPRAPRRFALHNGSRLRVPAMTKTDSVASSGL